MSIGHHFHRAASASSLEAVITLASVKRELARKRKIDREHDLPYLAGYSKDGGTIYIDRHMPKSMKYKGRDIDTDRFLVLHEEVEKALIDQLGFDYWKAHRIATRAEEDAEDAAGVPNAVFQKFFKPFIKADEHEKLIKVPADLDLTPYKAKPVDRGLLDHMRRVMKGGTAGQKLSHKSANYSDKSSNPRRHCSLCAMFIRPDDCSSVVKPIYPSGVCDLFERKA